MKILFKISITLLFFSLISCETNNQINKIYEDWIQVESSISTGKEDNSLEYFFKRHKEFTETDIYKNMIISETYGDSLKKLDAAIESEDIAQIRSAVFNLGQLDLLISQKSNHEYIYLSQLLLVFCVIISVFLFIIYKNYEKKRNEAKQMGIYSRFMIEGIETERSRISKEIHDTVLQDIKALSFKYELIDSADVQNNESLKDELISQTNSCISQLRAICNNLTPIELSGNNKDINGFILAIHNLIDQFTAKSGIECILKMQDKLDISSLSMKQTINIFRIIQEALNNIEKHAKASIVSIIITIIQNNNQEILKIFITDNGVGFNSEKLLKTTALQYGHFGISNMRNRAKDINASFSISSEINSGTEIKLEVPVK
ncbi:MAG: histidine kinase [Spirochaetales bacterium]|nr:histidine kinase [Spirochaetales bacterium]MDY5914457.1 histidine kinase [Treponema sp.]